MGGMVRSGGLLVEGGRHDGPFNRMPSAGFFIVEREEFKKIREGAKTRDGGSRSLVPKSA
jgi:hypothetical protein